VAPLTRVLATDADAHVRAEAALALGVIGGEAALASLLGATANEDTTVRLAVMEALGRYADPRARVVVEDMRRRADESRAAGREVER
jgi:HEAT repeat protein